MTSPSPAGRQYLFQDQTTNATSSVINLNYPTGKVLITAWSPSNAWGGATVTLYYLTIDGTQVPVSQQGTILTYTANQGLEVEAFPYGEPLIAVITGSSGSSDISVMVEPVAG